MGELKLIELVRPEILQELQDVMERKTNLSSIILDEEGNNATVFHSDVPFCSRMTKGSVMGCMECERCNHDGALRSLSEGHVAIYKCHTGLIDMAVPILVEGRVMGYVMGGQVTTEPLKKEEIYALAKKYDIPPEEYWESAQRVPIVDEEIVADNANFLNSIAGIISHIAYSQFQVLEASKAVENAAKMKSDFLANMSHEIRTPMNAVIGMADMALREELPEEARDYVNQIKRSGKTLLAIINDILDFSKIESGKMDITLGTYSPAEMMEDVANIIMPRLEAKDVELVMDIEPDLPKELMGDITRIKQVIINLANNAAKFTSEGQVVIHVKTEKTEDRWRELYVSVEDTGMGIKAADLDRIFESFQQVDSKRNRNIEGTGLGLAISKQLVSLMNGELGVESEYGKGSTFYFHIPQLQLAEEKEIELPENEELHVGISIRNKYAKVQLTSDILRLGGKVKILSRENIEEDSLPEGLRFVITDDLSMAEEIELLAAQKPELTCVLLVKNKKDYRSQVPNFFVVRRPVSVLTLAKLMNRVDMTPVEEDDSKLFHFVAPEAKVLVVDDNEVNLAVVVGLLEPLQMSVETAMSGKQAVELISAKHYDIIFMDHMMPEMDGVETTHIIRRFHQEYNDVPIIALTANVVEEAKTMLLVEGMDDFLGKPIELRALTEVVKRWLPPDKIVEVEASSGIPVEEELLEIPGLNLENARSLIGGEKVLRQVMENYYQVIDKKYAKIEEAYAAKDVKTYTIEVHALKSASRQIGADSLADMALKLEEAGNAMDVATIERDTAALLAEYRGVQTLLAPYFAKDEEEASEKPEITEAILAEGFAKLQAAMDDLDLTGMTDAITVMNEYRMPEGQQSLFEELKEAVDNIDIDECERIMGCFHY